MKNEKLKVKNEINYASPEVEIVKLSTDDVITTSPGTETPWYEESDGIWDLSI